MNLLLIATAFVAMATPQKKAAVTVTVNAKPAEVVSGERTFRVSVASKDPITGVEFYVGSDLREKDTSTPYEFTLDTIGEDDGKLTLKFRAFTTEGEEGSATVSVNVDNGLTKGAPFHLEAAKSALGETKWDAAIASARTALKIDGNNNDARIALARAYLGKGKLDRAQKFAEDALDADTNNMVAADLLTAIRLKQAFNAISRPGTEASDMQKSISDAYRAAIDARRKAVDAAFDKFGAPTAENAVAYSDAAIRGGRYGAAIIALSGPFKADSARTDVANRLAYSQLRMGRLSDALGTIALTRKYGKPDAYTFALAAVALAENRDAIGSEAAIKEGKGLSPNDPAVATAQAYIALKFVRRRLLDKVTLDFNYDDAKGKDQVVKAQARQDLQTALTGLMADNGQKSEVLTFASALSNRLDEYGKGSDFFERAVLADPLNADAYLEQGNRSLALSQRGEHTAQELDQAYQIARIHFEAALAARPSSAEALAGLSIVSSFQRKFDEAVKWGEAAVRATPEYPAGHVAVGVAYFSSALAKRAAIDQLRKVNAGGTTNADRQASEVKARAIEEEAVKTIALARDAGRRAADLDGRLEGLELTKPKTAWRYFYAGGRTPLLPLPR